MCRTFAAIATVFFRCALSIGDGETALHAYMPLFLKQSPLSAVFLELRKEPLLLPAIEAMEPCEFQVGWRRAKYSFLPPRFFVDCDVPITDDDAIYVHTDLNSKGAHVYFHLWSVGRT